MTRKNTFALIITIFCFMFTLQNGVSNGIDHSHDLWTEVLKHYVKNGRVDYQGLQKNQETFQKYLAQLGSVDSKEFTTWTKNQKLAYYINAYNAYTMKAILDHYPVKSIKKIPGVWKKLTFKVAGKEITLDHIEHKILRKKFDEPRIHFAVNCASIGCPEIRDEAYIAAKIHEQLDDSIQKMLVNKDQFRIDHEKKRVYLSKILEWFRDDFKTFKGVDNYGKNNGVISFLVQHLPEPEKKRLTSEKYSVKWLKYDWNLNK